MAKAKYFYLEWDHQSDEDIKAAPESGELVDFESDCNIHRQPSCAAADAAQARYEDAGGDLSDPDRWPRKFYLFDSDKKYVGLFSVDMEYSPEFYPHRMDR